MIEIVNDLFRFHLRKYQYELDLHYQVPLELQRETFQNIITTNAATEFGRQHGFDHLSTAAYGGQVPVVTYDELEPLVQQALQRENVLTATRIRSLAKTAGTTSGRSKYIPITKESLLETHHKGSWLTMAALYQHREDLKIFARKNLLIGGGLYGNYPGTDVQVGDISALMIQSLPIIVRPFYIPDVRTATLPNYEEKIKIIAELGAREDSITMLGGVPTWNLTLYRRILDLTGASNLLEVWPNLQAYIHGGVSFPPYRETFEALIPSPDFVYLEVYNASEGYFGVQDRLDRDDLLLLLNNGIYYEFIPFDEYKSGGRHAIPLTDVRENEPYVMVISTNNGLYRYLIGDLITFTSTNPYRIRIIGRTQEYINAFGEDLLVENAERALVTACRQHQAIIAEYTIAPYYLKVNERGRHQWFIEFEREPAELSLFMRDLDRALQQENSNYQQKRSNDFAIDQLEVLALPKGFFEDWLRGKGKLGGQNKVPKLANHRRFAEEFLEMLQRPA